MTRRMFKRALLAGASALAMTVASAGAGALTFDFTGVGGFLYRAGLRPL